MLGCSCFVAGHNQDGSPTRSAKRPNKQRHVQAGDPRRLFHTALLYLHPRNRKIDLEEAYSSFSRLMEEFPASREAEQAAIVVALLRDMEAKEKQIERLKEVIARLEHANRELKARVVHLERESRILRGQLRELRSKMERLKQVDLETEKSP